MPKQNQAVHVAVGVILNENSEVLIALRPIDSHQGGLWEFPGGKVESGETLPQALERELREELGIEVRECAPLLQIHHDYSDKSVLLDVWTIEAFSATPSGREGQVIAWRKLQDLRAADFPVANERIIRALRLPPRIAITPPAEDFAQLQETLSQQIDGGAELVYFRQKQLDPAAYKHWYGRAREQCKRSAMRLMYCHPGDSIADIDRAAIDALHVNSTQLREITTRPLPAGSLFSASCHDLEELKLAEALDADFVFLSPVCATEKYADAQLLGWTGFEDLARQVNVPVYALGGVSPADLPACRAHKGFGVAGISAFWAA